MDIQEILSKAFDIGNTITFTVKKYKKENQFLTHLSTEVSTYTELGIYLTSNKNNISSVNIILKE